MSFLRSCLFSGALAAALASPLLAASSDSKQSSAPTINLSGPEVIKLDWATRGMQVFDIDGNGRDAIAVINNDRSMIEILRPVDPTEEADAGESRRSLRRNRWDPVLEDARFRRSEITVNQSLFSLAVADLNGDGKGDLAYSGRETPLTVRFQGSEGLWDETITFDEPEPMGGERSLQARDVTGDGQTDLVLLARNGLFLWTRNDDGTLNPPVRFPTTIDNPFDLVLSDVNGNGRLDALYLVTDGGTRVILREQVAVGRFGPEVQLPLDGTPRELVVIPGKDGQPDEFAHVEMRSGVLETFQIKRGEEAQDAATSARAQTLLPEVYPVRDIGGRTAVNYAIGDFLKPGQAAIAAVGSASPEILVFPREAGGHSFAPPQRYPGFSGMTSMAAIRRDSGKTAGVVVVSPGEKQVGFSQKTPEGRLSFPALINIKGAEPLAVASADLNNDGNGELLLLAKRDNQSVLIVLINENDAVNAENSSASAGTSWKIVSETPIEGIRRDPNAIRVLENFSGAPSAIAVFTPREPALFFTTSAEELLTFKPFAKDSAVRSSLMRNLEPGGITPLSDNMLGDILIIGDRGFARALRPINDSFELVDQFNARRSDDVVAAILPGTVDEDGTVTDLFFYVKNTGELQSLTRGEDGVFRYRSTHAVGTTDLQFWTANAERDWLFFGSDRFWRLAYQTPSWVRVPTGRYQSDIEGVRYNSLLPLRLGETDAILAMDGRENMVDILLRSEEGTSETPWRSVLYWRVFEENLHHTGRGGSASEPRQAITGDWNSNGRTDLALLVHNRILFFFNEDE